MSDQNFMRVEGEIVNYKQVLRELLHKEVENLLHDMPVVNFGQLFDGAISITLPVHIHQDMVNAALIATILKNLSTLNPEMTVAQVNEFIDKQLLKNGAQAT